MNSYSPFENKLFVTLWFFIYFATLIWSAIDPKDYTIWALETAPAVVVLIILFATYKDFPLTPLLYWLMLLFGVILMIGGHYTYSEVPFFDTISHYAGWERNNYDKLGHFGQGFVPALIMRELFLRFHVIKKRSWMNLIIIAIAFAFSAAYELVEWWVAVVDESAAEAFLGMQGDVWDAQSDMFFALIGAAVALLVLEKYHDKQLKRYK